MKPCTSLLCLLGTILFSSLASAQEVVPGAISFQGSVSVNGEPFTGTGQFKFALVAKNPLTSSPVQATASVTSRNNGTIETIRIDNPGAGYTKEPTVTITGGGGSGATASVLVDNFGTGAVERIFITNAGSGYTSAPTVTLSAPRVAEQGTWNNTNAFTSSVSEPPESESIPVNEGRYSVLLGGESMPSISPDDLNLENTFLRVWFSSNGVNFQQLSPDYPLASTPFSLVSRTVIGLRCRANGEDAVATGFLTTASGRMSTAMGDRSIASGSSSIAVGFKSIASGSSSVAMGSNTLASNFGSTAIGFSTIASGQISSALGTETRAVSFSETAIGSYNTLYTPSSSNQFSLRDRIFSIGNGSSENSRSDALIMLKNGQSFFRADPGTTNGNLLNSYAAVHDNIDATSGSDVLALKVATNNPGNASNFLAFFAGNGNGSVIGEIDGNGAGGVRFQSNGADYAEYLPPLDPTEILVAGDVVAVRSGKITRDTTSFDQLMVISTNPIIIGNRPKDLPEDESGYHKVAFIGQVPVKVIGTVNSGDYLIASGQHDGAAIAKSADRIRTSDRARIIGRAWDSSLEPGEKLINAAVGLDHGPALVAEINHLKQRLTTVENYIKAQTTPVAHK